MSEKKEEIQKPSFVDQVTSSFNMNNNLSGIYLWLLFGFLSVSINCDLQRLLRKNPIILHVIGIYTFFFLFTSIEENSAGLIGLWVKTILIYILFVMTTKSKWYFAITVLLLLLFDKNYKYYIDKNKQYWNQEKIEKQMKIQEHVTLLITILILITICFGTIHYIYLQKIEYKDKFSYYKFFVSSGKCKSYTPDYSNLQKKPNKSI